MTPAISFHRTTESSIPLVKLVADLISFGTLSTEHDDCARHRDRGWNGAAAPDHIGGERPQQGVAARIMLAPNVATVWWMPVASLAETVLPGWAELLDDEEHHRALRFVQAEDRRAFIAAHLLLRVALQEAMGRRAASWRFVAGTHGKPALDPVHGLPRLAFNLSHTRGAVACALTLDYPIGIDIEDGTRLAAASDVPFAYFAPAEINWLLAAPVAERDAAFFKLWTLKEAFVKALGAGLSLPLDGFALHPDPAGFRFTPPPGEHAMEWQFHHAVPDGRHHLALALRHGANRGPVSLVTRRITLPELRLRLSRDHFM